MIYTVTLNPSVDLYIPTNDIKTGKMNRIEKEYTVPGGKALRVSRMLERLRIPTVATGFVGGFQGLFIEDWMKKENILTDFVTISEPTRTNVKFISNGKETYINSVGPSVKESEVNELIYYLSRVAEGDTVIMGGSLPVLKNYDIYQRMISVCKANKASFVIDIPAKYLPDAIKERPVLVKPNREDVEEMFNVKLDSDEKIIKAGKEIIKLGAKNVIISLAENGAMFFSENGDIYRGLGIDVDVINTVGARDSMIAGFIGTYVKHGDNIESFRVSLAAATASLVVNDIPDADLVNSYINLVKIEKLN
ncbi:MAG: 1-phosphofructokinase family hexose kinase [Peptoniphilaceae bacterium]|nr:1-phosphofructokinase family hexose kinase [Peptoniphilaceae bacterium]MDD7383874.1 1-phosphofructokinase family hexose kinase [Peptoniphilaceae bacterium]MDY3738015.1 1-phosphofructokinase family hexose kinase [Peptoniphilaceae bacterium]